MKRAFGAASISAMLRCRSEAGLSREGVKKHDFQVVKTAHFSTFFDLFLSFLSPFEELFCRFGEKMTVSLLFTAIGRILFVISGSRVIPYRLSTLSPFIF